MNKLITRLKSIRLDRILTVFLAGLMLFVSTACSGGASAKTADEVRQEVPGSAVTNKYQGGMNEYSDVDPRQSTTESKAKAKGLIDNAQKNIDQKSVDSPEQYGKNLRSGTPLGERVRRIGEDVGKAAKNVTEDVSKGTRENARNTKETAQDAASGAKQAADKAGNAVQSKVSSDIQNTKRAVDKAGDAVQSKVSSDVKNTKQAVSKAAEKAADVVD